MASKQVLHTGTLYKFTWSDGSSEDYKIEAYLTGDWYKATKGKYGSMKMVMLNISQARVIE